MVFVLIPEIPIEAHVVKKVVPLENSVMLDHPVIGLAHVGLEQHGRDIGMVGGAQRVTNVVQQGAHHVFFIFPVFDTPGWRFAGCGSAGLWQSLRNRPQAASDEP